MVKATQSTGDLAVTDESVMREEEERKAAIREGLRDRPCYTLMSKAHRWGDADGDIEILKTDVSAEN